MSVKIVYSLGNLLLAVCVFGFEPVAQMSLLTIGMSVISYTLGLFGAFASRNKSQIVIMCIVVVIYIPAIKVGRVNRDSCVSNAER